MPEFQCLLGKVLSNIMGRKVGLTENRNLVNIRGDKCHDPS